MSRFAATALERAALRTGHAREIRTPALSLTGLCHEQFRSLEDASFNRSRAANMTCLLELRDEAWRRLLGVGLLQANMIKSPTTAVRIAQKPKAMTYMC